MTSALGTLKLDYKDPQKQRSKVRNLVKKNPKKTLLKSLHNIFLNTDDAQNFNRKPKT